MADIDELKGDVRVLKSVVEAGQKETGRRLDKIESKIDAQQNVPVAAFEEYKKEVTRNFVTRDQLKPVQDDVAFIKKILYSFIGLIVLTVLAAMLRGVLA